jgi:DeoR family transcriptional regulator, deoxyribose operon repressor
MEKANMKPRMERLKIISNALKVRKAATIRELAEILSVSEMTVRRDLGVLEEQGMVKLIHGGAIFCTPGKGVKGLDSSSFYLDRDDDLYYEQKIRIARKAASMIQPKDVIFIDAGSTTECMCEFTPGNTTIISYSLNILYNIYDQIDCEIIFCGGYFHNSTMMFECPQSVELICQNRANKAFLSARGVSDEFGVTTSNRYEIDIKRAAINSSQERILLVDSSKMGKVRPVFMADLDSFDAIITDDGISEEFAAVIRARDIVLHIV